jgi:regulator of protease activity HflC (stomatin/prohibitin superfamily)
VKYLLVLIALGLVGCSVYSPDAGHEIVLIEKPWIFGHGGVDSDPIKPGRTFAAITTDGVDVYMQPQKFDTEMHDTMTSDGVPISFHAIVVLQVTDSVALIKNFGPTWYQNNLEEQFKTMVRQAVRKRGMNETAISTTALDAIDAEIRDALKAFIKEKGLPIQLVTMTVGRANPPDAIRISALKRPRRSNAFRLSSRPSWQKSSASRLKRHGRQQIMLIDRLSVYHLSSMSS